MTVISVLCSIFEVFAAFGLAGALLFTRTIDSSRISVSCEAEDAA